jgi:ATP-binding cassette, subfamily B, bacterial
MPPRSRRAGGGPVTSVPAPPAGPATAPGPGWVRRLWGCLLRHKGTVALALAGSLFGSGGQAFVPLVGRQIVDGVIVRRDAPLWPWLLVLIGSAVATFGFAHLRRYYGGKAALAVQYDLRNAMHDHLQTMDQDNPG